MVTPLPPHGDAMLPVSTPRHSSCCNAHCHGPAGAQCHHPPAAPSSHKLGPAGRLPALRLGLGLAKAHHPQVLAWQHVIVCAGVSCAATSLVMDQTSLATGMNVSADKRITGY